MPGGPRTGQNSRLGRDLDVQYRTAFVLCHRLREAPASEMTNETVGGTVEVDGAYVGGHIHPRQSKREPSRPHASAHSAIKPVNT
jgi:hypothetical protein